MNNVDYTHENEIYQQGNFGKKITIAVIEKNNCNFDRIEEFVLPLLYKEHEPSERKMLKEKLNAYIWSEMEKYVKFVDLKEEDFISTVCTELTKCFPDKVYDDFYYHTEGSYSFPKKYIEFIHCQPLWSSYQKNQNMNNIACLFSLKHNIIENNCVVFTNDFNLEKPHFTEISSITKEDIIRVIRRRYFFSAVLIRNDQFIKYYYQNPAYLVKEIYGLSENDNIKFLPMSLFRYNLLFYFQHDKTKNINKPATRMNGTYRLYGDVIMLHELEENIFGNLSIREAKQLNVLAYGRLYDRQLKPEEMHSATNYEIDENGAEKEKKIIPFWSRYVIGKKRMEKWNQTKNKCIYCCQEMTKPLVCSGCYRVKYCSETCQKDFSVYHADECLKV